MRSGSSAPLTLPGRTMTRVMVSCSCGSRASRVARASSIAAIAARVAAPSPSSPFLVICSRKASAAVTRRSVPSSRIVTIWPSTAS